MPDKNILLAKISRPSASGILPRERLFRALDSVRKSPIVWLSGPAGSGKTTLIASYLDSRKLPSLWYQMDEGDADIATFFYYMGLAAIKANTGKKKPLPLLTSEYLAGVPTFTRRYFEELYSRFDLSTPPHKLRGGRVGLRQDARRCVIVFDNYQDVPLNSSFHETIAHGLDAVPEGITIIILSRNEPPPPYARLRANSRTSIIGWDELRLTTDESREIVRLKGQKDIEEELIVQLQGKTQGWVAGLVLIMEMLGRQEVNSPLPDKHTPQEIFDYFAGEVFQKTGGEMREFLLKTAFLPKITSHIAERLTGIGTADQILTALNRHHYFTERHIEVVPVYQYHPLFREFLLSRAKSVFAPETLAGIQRNAAALLEEAGQIEDAASLLRDAQDWGGFVRVILAQAQSLIAQGRSRTLEEWLSSIPEGLMKGNPWLLYWMGGCRIPFDPRESLAYFEQAFGLFKKQGEATGLYLSWSGIIETFIYGRGCVVPLDRWISEFETLQREYPAFPSPEVYARAALGIFYSLMYRRPQHPDLPLWEERLKDVAMGASDIRLRMLVSSQLVLYYVWWRGDMNKAKLLIDNLRPLSLSPDIAPLPLIAWRVIESIYYWMTARNEECMNAVREGLKVAEISGVHLWDDRLYIPAAYSALLADDTETAGEYIQKMAAKLSHGRLQEVIFYHYLSGWKALFLNNLPIALEHAKAGLKAAAEVGMPYAEGVLKNRLAEILFENGEHEKAREYLDDALHLAAEMRNRTLESQCFEVEAKFLFDQGENESALKALRKHLEIDREHGIFSHAWWRNSVMARLYAKALEAGIEVEHVREVIRRHNLVPNPSMPYIEAWPYPIMIYTLGGFEIVINGKPVTFSGKVQQKPLAMLKAIIALGGNASEEQLADILWPDAEGDIARKSFDITLLRLRRLLGDDQFVQIRGGKLALDIRYCRVDMWVFERLAEQAQACETEGGGPIPGLLERTVGLYKGSFLPMDKKYHWTYSCRELLRNKFLSFAVKLGERLEQSGQWEEAAGYYQKALETDDLAEEFYQHLMLCYQRLGQQTRAIETYSRCRSILSSALGLDPSARTEEIFQGLRSEKR